MTGCERPSITLLLTVKNEEESLPAFFASVDSQTLLPNEVVLVDGGSTDGTLDVARRWKTTLPFIIVSEPGANISTGRNLALERATGTIVAVCDAGTRLAPDWLEKITEPFGRPSNLQPDVVAGFFEADPTSVFELTLGTTTLPDVDEIRAERFLPSSRSIAFRRGLFDSGVRYPQWLDYCEDLIFDLKLKRAGARFEFNPGARVAFRPRTSVRSYWLQYYRYARGDGKAGIFGPRHVARYATYLGLLPWAMQRRDRFAVATIGIGTLVYVWKPLRRLRRRRKQFKGRQYVVAHALVPVLRLIGDVAKMTGYPVGLWWRWHRYGLRQTWMTISEDTSGSGSDLLE